MGIKIGIVGKHTSCGGNLLQCERGGLGSIIYYICDKCNKTFGEIH